jgi:phage FluMu protein Com
VSKTSFLDGNAAAGELSELFSVDVTAATGRCAACGKVAALGEGHLYSFEPGMVIRCAACLNPLLRLVKASGRAWIDLRGLECLQITLIQSETAGVSET